VPGERLNRYISSAAGVSRRTADELVRKGRVTVDGMETRDPGTLVDPGTAEVRLDGNTLIPAEEPKVFIMFFKPDGVVTTMREKEGRKTVADFVDELPARVFPVGRLDYHTTGLLLLTNDGELSYKITHPRFGVEKTYIAKVQGVPHPSRLAVLRRGLPIDGVMTNPAYVRQLEARGGKAWISIRIAEGRHHQVRKMFEAIGHRVMKLRRTAIGSLELSGVEPGQWRPLTGKEVRDLKAYVASREQEAAAAPPPPAATDRRPAALRGRRGSHGKGKARTRRPDRRRS
jgi:23S rRNA pseudouridine2605 synthase